ncbi:uncharacterized protein LOC125946298 [Dermacentor silvarum]|uniref:uncharacterized protein LOC125946298 n=1 Tax=Dermacentor silvarum TaxID=543639 RepID=UPI0021019F73|nr:uncharacterized protein LOC125946298 [Dermacentor silvarum]
MGNSPLLYLQVAAICAACPSYAQGSLPVVRDTPILLPVAHLSLLRLDTTHENGWQPGSSTSPINASITEYKQQATATHFGHDTATSMGNSPLLYLQVSYLQGASCLKTNNYYLVAVSCPHDLCEKLRCLSSACRSLIRLSLLLSGDVEENPGPEHDTITSTLESVLETMRRLEVGQAAILNELKCVKEKQEATESKLSLLSGRVETLEATVASINPVGCAAPSTQLREICDRLRSVTLRCDDTENRLRRNNLLFFGISDSPGEDWAASEQKVINFCSEHLGVTAVSSQFERVHRLGRFHSEKCRPLIAKYSSFKDKQGILSAAHKLKGTTFSIREDFSPATRQARRKLIEFARTNKKPFKLSLDKMRMDSKTYMFDNVTDGVVLSTT